MTQRNISSLKQEIDAISQHIRNQKAVARCRIKKMEKEISIPLVIAIVSVSIGAYFFFGKKVKHGIARKKAFFPKILTLLNVINIFSFIRYFYRILCKKTD